jgi:hypothetical protein
MSLYVWRVIVFLYVGSRRLLHNLTDMHRKPSACIGLHMGMVPKSYHHLVKDSLQRDSLTESITDFWGYGKELLW